MQLFATMIPMKGGIILSLQLASVLCMPHWQDSSRLEFRGASQDLQARKQSVSFVTSSHIKCHTFWGSVKPSSILTTTHASTSSFPGIAYVHSTSDPIVTITPSPVTQVKEVTTRITTVAPVSDATTEAERTKPVYKTDTKTVMPATLTNTTTIQTTKTVYTSTSTVPTPSGFEGVRQTGLPSSKNSLRAEMESFEDRESTYNQVDSIDDADLVSLNQNNLYEKKVICHNINSVRRIIYIIKKGPTETKTLVPSTLTRTSTITQTIFANPPTSVLPSATRKTITTTITTTTTTTVARPSAVVTKIKTATLSLPTTSYAACAPNTNLLGPKIPNNFPQGAGEVITDLTYNASTVSLLTTPGDTGYDCCVQCLNYEDGDCAFGSWEVRGICYLHLTSSGKCAAQSQNEGTYDISNPPRVTRYAVYNGPCGYLTESAAPSKTALAAISRITN